MQRSIGQNGAVRVEEGDRVESAWNRLTPDPGPGTNATCMSCVPTTRTSPSSGNPPALPTSGPGLRHLAAILAHQAAQGRPEERAALAPLKRDGMPAPHPVHRLDRATSGWVCVALTLHTAGALGRAFAERLVEKRYLALAQGHLEDGTSEDPLDGKPARTAWRVLGHGPLPVHGTATLLEVRPTTGRTHQIRRHLAAAGHPLVGEDQHAVPGLDPQTAPRYTGHGLFLCAIGLSIPEGDHGPAAEVTGRVPRKYKRIRWAAEALAQHGFR